jgi:GAF domain-containing protein
MELRDRIDKKGACMPPAEDADLVSLLEQVLDAAIKLQGAEFGDIELYDVDKRTLRIVAHRGVGQAFLEHFGCTEANDPSACGIAMSAGHRVW